MYGAGPWGGMLNITTFWRWSLFWMLSATENTASEWCWNPSSSADGQFVCRVCNRKKTAKQHWNPPPSADGQLVCNRKKTFEQHWNPPPSADGAERCLQILKPPQQRQNHHQTVYGSATTSTTVPPPTEPRLYMVSVKTFLTHTSSTRHG